MGVLGGGFDYHPSYFYTSYPWGEQLLHTEGKRKSGRRQTTGEGYPKKTDKISLRHLLFP